MPDTDQRGVAGDEVAGAVPVSSAIAVIASVAVGSAVSMVTAWLVGGADIAGGVDNPRRVGEARAVRVGGVVIAPARAGLRNIVPGGAAVAADLDLLARSQRAVAAGHRSAWCRW